MDLKEFDKRMQRLGSNLQSSIKNDLPRVIGVEAVNHYQQGFQNEGFTNTVLIKWAEVKRRMTGSKSRPADRERKILTGRTGLLHDSIDYETAPGKTIVFANPQNKGAQANYAKVHQFGTNTAGRGNKTTVPARPIIGESAQLMAKINDKIIRRFISIIKTNLK
ncbi:MAG: hypothetical protein HC819_14890 [Cyclobacteriaceae bacterium]|nr:hypothetical protein [Cyclobacteriaceae bacterium]